MAETNQVNSGIMFEDRLAIKMWLKIGSQDFLTERCTNVFFR